ncbi:hypothetical protein EKL97_10160 [Flavobacterium sp. LS1P28]|uniref:hypothetical protein n=1 Tax=Flavobacterium sp. LS1P28 TaxID=2497752 RepID=UPI000F828245|nr:hypothetical protein [Flavobacterium sp. LS1P28]RTY80624.1 hypothetical protein EKL97_10160 [Flavobacterium sp. LS1P28]
MSFINNLAKGFVRSVVNQVGRDGGKVISNKVYGNSHSTPIKIAGSNNIYTSDNLIEEKECVYIKFFWAILLSTLIPLIGSLIVIYRGYVNIKKNKTSMYKIEKQPVYSIDRRHTTGKRLNGYREIKVPFYIEIDEKQKAKNKFKSIGYFVISFSILIIYIISQNKYFNN